ncbi:hypothetical protein ACOMHN_017843 [Nucella lapillus]
MVLCNKPFDLTSVSSCQQKEADTRIMLHLQHAAQQGHQKAFIRTVDSDVVILAVSLFHDLGLSEVWVGLGTGCQHQYGKKFIVALPYGANSDPAITARSNMRLLLTNPGSIDVIVTVVKSGPLPTPNLFPIVVPSKGSKEETFTPSGDYMLPQNGVSTGPSVTLESTIGDFGVLVQGTQAYDGYLAIPVSSWGKAYRVASHCQGANATCQLVILTNQNAKVKVILPSENAAFSAEDSGRTYAGAINLTQSLSANAAWVIPKSYEMSGALVTSDVNIGVLAGSQWTGYYGSEGTVTEQLPPLTSLGQEFVSLGVGTVRVVTTEPQTTIHTSDSPPVLMPTAGQWLQQFLQYPVYIRANRPVLVVELKKFQSSSSWYPVFTVLTPVIQFLKHGDVVTVPPSPNEVLAVIRANKSDVMHGSIKLDDVGSFSSTAAVRSDYLVGVVPVSVGILSVVNNALEVVGFYVKRVESSAAFLSPLAARYVDVNPEKDCTVPTQQKAGDTIDNDCDGLVDEDDCTSAGSEVRSTWGRHFVLVVPQYYNSSEKTLSLALTTLSTSPVATYVRLPDDTWHNQSLPNSSETTSVALTATTGDVLLVENRSPNVIRISSDHEISVTFYVSYPKAHKESGALKLIPERSLGREYYVVTFGSNPVVPANQFQVVSVHDNTSIAIHLKLRSTPQSNKPLLSAYVIFLGHTYYHGDVIRTDVSSYEALRIECITECIMTGTLVVASKPVAVFSMSDTDRLSYWYTSADKLDIFLEQLPPVETYGREYNVMQEPARLIEPNNHCSSLRCHDVIWIVSSEVQTTVQVSNAGNLTTHLIDRAGDILHVTIGGSGVQISSDRPILVLQVLLTLYENSGALLVVPSRSQYVQKDVIRFLSMSPNIQVMLYAASTSVHTVFVDGQKYSLDLPVNETLFNMSYLLLKYNSTSQQTEITIPSGMKFGGYVSQMDTNMESIFPLAYTAEHTNVPCVVTKAVRGDMIDSDCDGHTDEESCPEGSELDDDGDGRFNEDCVTLPEVTTTEPPETTSLEETTPKDTTPEDTTPENPTTSSSSSSSSTPSPLCSCNCQRIQPTTSLPPASLSSVIKSIVKELSVDKTQLSSVRRKKVSAEDDRPSAQTVGYFGVAIIIATAVGIVILDSGALYRDVKRLIASCKTP